MRLTPAQRREILTEMQLAELFTEKAWARRYQISPATVKRLRAEARERRLIRNVSTNVHVLVLDVGSRGVK